MSETVKKERTYKKFTWESAIDFVYRNAVWILLIIVGAFIVEPDSNIIKTLALITLLEGLALGFSNVALYVYTSYNVTKYLHEGDDGEMNSVERHAALHFAGMVIIAVHLLVAFGWYFIQFADKG